MKIGHRQIQFLRWCAPDADGDGTVPTFYKTYDIAQPNASRVLKWARDKGLVWQGHVKVINGTPSFRWHLTPKGEELLGTLEKSNA